MKKPSVARRDIAVLELLDFVKLVHRGLQSGMVKCEPIMDFKPNATSIDMYTLDDLAERLLKKHTPAAARPAKRRK